MSKKSNPTDLVFEQEVHITKPYIDSPIEEQIESSMLAYGTHIIKDRAIPSALDGLKPVQRRILYSFVHDNNINNLVKLQKATGSIMGNFHPHGDSSIDGAVASMVQPWKNNVPLLVGQGGWGSMGGYNPSASRYIEVELPNSSADLLFEDLKKEGVVPWEKNYNNELMEPKLLPVKIPVHLVNGTSGISYSMSTNIPPFNLNELTKAMLYLIDNKFWDNDTWKLDEHLDNLLAIIPGPDIPTRTNVIIHSNNGNKYAHITESNFSFGMRAKIECDYENQQITITNIPLNQFGSRIEEEIVNLAQEFTTEKQGRKEIVTPRPQEDILQLSTSHIVQSDYDARDKIYCSITLTFKKDADLNVEKGKLLNKTSINTVFNAQLMVINDHGSPEQMSLYKNLRVLLHFRKRCVLAAKTFDINKQKEIIHLQNGLMIVLNDKETLFKILKDSKQVMEDLKFSFPQLDDIQSEYILDIPIKRITKAAIETLIADIDSREKLIKESELIIANNETLFAFIKNDYLRLLETPIFKNAKRVSPILTNVANISAKDLVEMKDIIVMAMKDGTIGYLDVSNISSTSRGSKLKNTSLSKSKIKMEVESSFKCTTKSSLFVLTNKGKVFTVDAYRLNSNFSNARNYFNLDNDESVIKVFDADTPELDSLILVTPTKMKSIKLDLFKNTTDNRSKIAIKLEDNEQVIQVLQHNSNYDEDILIISTTGGVLRFNKATLREHSGGNTMGRGVVSNGNFIKSCLLVPISGDKLVLLTSDTGKAKVLKLEYISRKKIKQTPNTAFKNNDKNGNLISGLLLDGIEVTELTITASNGKLSLVKFNPQKIIPVHRQARGSIILIDVVDNRIIDVQASAEVQEEALDEEMITAQWDENASNTDLDEEITTNEEPLF